MKKSLFLCAIFFSGCGFGEQNTPASDAIKALIENCDAPVGMEVRITPAGTEFSVRCDKMKRDMMVEKIPGGSK